MDLREKNILRYKRRLVCCLGIAAFAFAIYWVFGGTLFEITLFRQNHLKGVIYGFFVLVALALAVGVINIPRERSPDDKEVVNRIYIGMTMDEIERNAGLFIKKSSYLRDEEKEWVSYITHKPKRGKNIMTFYLENGRLVEWDSEDIQTMIEIQKAERHMRTVR